MAPYSSSFEALLVACEELLPRLQSRFDAYQRENFPERVPEFFCLELCGEAGELANLEKKQWKGHQVDRKQFAEEAADVLIALVNYANARGIELGAAIKAKLGTIEQRRQQQP
jgi:NTP pyrophosphatase (non-canonical NTP hydrolase)